MRRVAVVVLAVLAVGLGSISAAPAAEAASCMPAGGATFADAKPTQAGDFGVIGRGWGHGVGMSQHGAQGAALLGCSVADILGTYYPGTSIVDKTDRSTIIVGLFAKDAPFLPQRINVEVRDDSPPLTWTYEGAPIPGSAQPTGVTWQVQTDGAGRLSLWDGDTKKWEAPSTFGILSADLGADDRRVYLPYKDVTYNRGSLRFQPEGSGEMFVTVRLPFEQYLYGLAEMPSSWPLEALKAQAIAGRSYAHTKTATKSTCQCHLVDSPSDQVYRAANKELEPGYGQNWVRAVDETEHDVLTYEGAIAATFYSSTHGGQSERLGFSSFFGPTDLPYLKAVDDSRWELESSSDANGVLRWAQTFSREHMTAAMSGLGVGTVQSIRVRTPTGAGGRVGNPDRTVPGTTQHYGGVEILGSQGTATISGLDFANRVGFNRRSELFTVVAGPSVQCAPTSDQSGNTTIARASGPSRVDTAVAVSKGYWDSADDVVLATSESFPDALSAVAFAARLGAPVLLTSRDEPHDAVETELARLGASTVHLMGGTVALSGNVSERLRDLGYTVERIAGPSRYDTARAAALEAGPSESGEVALALGDDWPDAVSAGALAASPDRVPVLLSTREDVPDVTMDTLAELGATKVLLVGGTAVLSDAVASELDAAGYEVARLSGPSRLQTSVDVAEDAAGRADDDRPIVLATAGAFPDALAAGALAARLGGGLLLTPSCDLAESSATLDHLEDGPYDEGVIVGGVAAVSDLVREQATTAVTP